MTASKFLGSFLQSALFGGTYDDLAFEIRVLKAELQALHERLDKELVDVSDRIDKLEGKPGRGRGRSRLSILSSGDIADMGGDGKLDAAPSGGSSGDSEPAETASSSVALAQSAPAASPFVGSLTIAEAHALHPGAQAVFSSHHLSGCLSCGLSSIETIESGAVDHGLDVEGLLHDLNQLVLV